jgi:murein DD-endopeptidase MepM/ murein hydrolase activator NlpD
MQMLTQTYDTAHNSSSSGHRGGTPGKEFQWRPALGAPYRITDDYKPAVFDSKSSISRLPWFVAGLSIPLLCVGFIAPQFDVSEPAASAGPGPALAADSTDTGATAAPGPQDAPAESTAATTFDAPGKSLTLKVRSGDSLDRLFKRNHLDRADLAAIMKLDAAHKHLRLIKPGDEILVRQTDGQVLTLSKPVSLSERLTIERVGEAFKSEIIERELFAHRVHATGTINSSLFLAAAAAGISDRTIMNLAGIFAWDVDFVLDIRQGDQFSLIYEELLQGGERLADGEILAAEFVNQGEVFRAVRFEDKSGRVDYFTPDGRSVRKAFLRAPLSFSRVSSNFNPRRRHPRLNTIRAHRGVDYAAPTGTPIKAAGDGKIIKRGAQGGYGKVVIVQHGGNITTLYAHMSRFSKARNGHRVRQGDIIGYVGATGLATGPHLHYEYRRNGVHLNPRTVKLPDAAPLDPLHTDDFQKIALPLLQQLDNPRTLFAAET